MEPSDKHFCKMNGIRFLNTKGKVHGNQKNNGSLFKLLGFHVGITFDVYVLLWWKQWNLLLSNLFAKNEILARKKIEPENLFKNILFVCQHNHIYKHTSWPWHGYFGALNSTIKFAETCP